MAANDLKTQILPPPSPYAMPENEYLQQPIYTPPTGQWRDEWYNCTANIWPSCGCVAMGGYFGSCLPVYLAGQISTRIGSFHNKVIMGTYLALVALFFFIAFIVILATGNALASWNIIYIPTWLVFFWLIFLRYKFVERYQITEPGFHTCLIAFFCSPCSLCQMARHQYGYSRVLDGDGLLDGNMVYAAAATTSSAPPRSEYQYTASHIV